MRLGKAELTGELPLCRRPIHDDRHRGGKVLPCVRMEPLHELFSPRIAEQVLSVLAPYSRRRTVMAGVSGGRDSVLLLHVLHRAGFKKVVVCHLNHRLRGRAAAGDAAFVRKLALEMGYRCITKQTDVRALAVKEKTSLETAGRRARHAFFAEVARATRARVVFLGHHADDRVETFLWNLFRGTGAKGLGALGATSTLAVENITLEIVRPLFTLFREEINQSIEAAGLKYREDQTNAELSPMRNKIRHRVLPLIRAQLGRDPRGPIWRAAEVLAAEEEFFAGLELPQGRTLRTAELAELPVALQRRAILRWLGERGVPEVGFAEIERVRALLQAHPGQPAKVNLPGGHWVRRRAGEIFLQQ
jgi:tRNA(Ile)-lysidine synthase